MTGQATRTPLRRALHGGVIADADGDGVVGAAEAEAFFKARFWAMDVSRDGQLDAVEFVRGDQAVARSARRLGTGRSGAPAFADLDLDGDGALSPEEFHRAVALRQDPGAGTKLRDPAWREIVFRQLDGDGDGRVSEAQFLAAAARRFAASDRDGDGAVSVWEFLAAPGF